MRLIRLIALAAATSAALTSAAAAAAPGVPEGAELSKGPDAGTLVYRKPGLDPSAFHGLYIAPARVDEEEGTTYKGVTAQDKQEIADFLSAELHRVLGASRTLAPAPGPGVLVVKPTLTGLQGSHSVAATALRLSPVGLALSAVKTAAGLPATFTGSVTFVLEFRDGGSGELVGAVSTKQSPPALNLASGVGKLTAAKLAVTQAAEALDRTLPRAKG